LIGGKKYRHRGNTLHRRVEEVVKK